MGKVLELEQREQAGSGSYNRFEYQVHWIVCHIIGQLENNAECIVFCEFHDDMAEFIPEKEEYQFYQIKTKEDSSDWTVAELSKREKKKSGGYKKSFLGFIYYNFLNFGVECSHCYFISNNDYDKDVRLWQSYIEDGKIVAVENNELYQRIKGRIKDEYVDSLPSNFDSVFDIFIQNTFVHKSKLQLSTYTTQTAGMFFDQLANKNIPTDTAHLIFQQLVNDVRKKSTEQIKTPISFKSLVDKKGIEISKINDKINSTISKKGNYTDFYNYLATQGLTDKELHCIESAKTLHDSRWLNVNDFKYQEIVITLRKVISTYIECMGDFYDASVLEKECMHELLKQGLSSQSLDRTLIEVLYYEQRFSKEI